MRKATANNFQFLNKIIIILKLIDYNITPYVYLIQKTHFNKNYLEM